MLPDTHRGYIDLTAQFIDRHTAGFFQALNDIPASGIVVDIKIHDINKIP